MAKDRCDKCEWWGCAGKREKWLLLGWCKNRKSRRYNGDVREDDCCGEFKVKPNGSHES